MRPLFSLSAAALLAFAGSMPITHAGPIDGVFAKKLEIPATGKSFTMRFHGGERASVQIVGERSDRKNPSIVHVTIEDPAGAVIADEKGRDTPSPDLLSVFWFPPRDGEYKITIRNTESRPAVYFIAMR
jgi:hypothetical protein